jgi:hypothetical protein
MVVTVMSDGNGNVEGVLPAESTWMLPVAGGEALLVDRSVDRTPEPLPPGVAAAVV